VRTSGWRRQRERCHREKYERLLLDRTHSKRRWENQEAEGTALRDIDRDEVYRILDLAREQTTQIEKAGHSADETGKLARRNLALTGQLREVVVDLSQESDALTQALAKFKL